MSMTVNTNPTMVSWEALLNQVNEASNAGKVSETNRSVTFTTQLDDGVASVIVNIPDDLELPSAVTPEAIETLMTKLGGADFNLNETQLALIKDEITKVYNQMAGALSATQSKSTGAVMFDLYQLMALLVEVAQSQRNAARDLRNTQNQQIQNSIQSQADAQRNAAIVGLVVGVTCGVLSAAVSVGMLVGQGAAYKTQVNTARMSGMEAAQNKVTMLQNADTPQHAQAQLAKVEGGIKTEGLAAGVKDTINANTLEAKNQFEAAKTVDAKQTRFNEADARLTEAQIRNRLEPEKGVFIAESPKVIRLALDAGFEPVSFLMEQKHIEGDAKDLLLRCPDIPVYTGERALLQSLTGYALTRGVLSAMKRKPLPAPETILSDAKRVAVLEGVVDASNLGAIVRSAAALNVDAVLFSPTCCDPLNRRAVRVSMGTIFQVPWTILPDWPEGGLSLLQAHGFRTAAMALVDDSLSMDDPRLKDCERLAIVLGTEGDGLSKETIEACDFAVKIPMAHGVDSLNVAAASAVAFWELRAE